MFFAYTLLAVALIISAVAEYYSILGLTAIFPGAFWPVVIMGASLGLGKIMAAVWLHRNWYRAGFMYKAYLVPATFALMVLTSMGVFGFLSQAHIASESGNAAANEAVALIDERIKVQQDYIAQARGDLEQLNSQVDKFNQLGSVSRGVTIRNRQQQERKDLLAQVETAQTEITKLREQRVPLTIEQSKIEAKVGPIKYVAALIYGDNPTENLLERAVRWMTILIVTVFDPLALILILAATREMAWVREALAMPEPEARTVTVEVPVERIVEVPVDREVIREVPVDRIVEVPVDRIVEIPVDREVIKTVEVPVERLVYPENVEGVLVERDLKISSLQEDVEDLAQRLSKVTQQNNQYLQRIEELQEIKYASSTSWGTTPPADAEPGDLFMNTSRVPHRLYKYNGTTWIPVDKNNTSSYLDNTDYLSYLIQLVDSAQIGARDLTPDEELAIIQYLGTNNDKPNNAA